MFWNRKADKELSLASSIVRFRLSLTGCCANADRAVKHTKPTTKLLIILCFFMFTINEPIN